MDFEMKNYQKKFPFERSKYHQCIPNPAKENEFITVQIVNRQMDSVNAPDGEESKKAKSLQYQRYNLKAPEDDDDEDWEEEESSGSEGQQDKTATEEAE